VFGQAREEGAQEALAEAEEEAEAEEGE